MNKNTAILFGLIGVVVIGLGAIVFNKQDASVQEQDNRMMAPGTVTNDTETSEGTDTVEHEDVAEDENAVATTIPTPPTVVDVDVSINAGLKLKAFTVTGENFSFAPAQLKVKKGDTVRITFKNVSGFHDLKIDEFNAATKQIGAGKEETITFVADKVGSFEYYCSVGQHRAMGMKGTLVVE